MEGDPAATSPLFLAAVVAATLGLLALAANWLRAFPYRGLVWLSLVPGLLSITLLFTGALWRPVLVLDALILVVALVDLVRLPRRETFAVERQVSRIASLQKQHPVTLIVSNLGAREYVVAVRDDVPSTFEPGEREFRLQLAGRSRVVLDYQCRCTRRGAFTMQRVHLRVRSPWALWQRYFDYPLASVVHVYPDLKQLKQYALLARANRLNLVGVRRSRRLGQDNEFERLRDYTPDDNYKFIDWRSTARRGKLTVKDFQANQSQRLIFLVDTGRMMTNAAAGLSLLDHALNSMLMLSYVALAHGDSVGLLTFSDEIHAYVPPHGGQNQMNRLLHASFDRFPRLVESRYDKAFLYLAAHCHRRALVVLITNLIDEVNRLQVEQYLASLVGKHLPLGVLLRDRRIFQIAEAGSPLAAAPAGQGAYDLYDAAAASDILLWRQQMLADLHAKGVLCLDVFPEELTAPLVNRYLSIKARHLL
ncbi:MAG: DUF58 domain-containing protein [Pirellulales bacterium]|nr:DUF58 domain-containing protein [Pirellulales bacterium]